MIGILLVVMRSGDEETAAINDERLARLRRDADAFAARARRGLDPISTRLILKEDEKAYLEEPSVLRESRAFRVFGGAGTRIGRVYVGGGASESHSRLRRIDEGTLTLTTKRLIFDGTHENRHVQLSEVMSVSPWADAIEVSTQRRAKSQIYQVKNPLIWASMIEAMAAGRMTMRGLSRGEP